MTRPLAFLTDDVEARRLELRRLARYALEYASSVKHPAQSELRTLPALRTPHELRACNSARKPARGALLAQ